MEEKQLNFNQPLLSVRRGSSIAAPPEVNKRKINTSNSILPLLPYYKSDLKSGPVRNPGAIPFQWEQTPGKPKGEKKERREIVEQHPLAPKLPPGRVATCKQETSDKRLNDSPASSSRSYAEKDIPCSLETSPVGKTLSELEGSENGKEDESFSSSEDENVVYEDARDTLSRTESFFVNCSISGVSGLDGPDKEPFGSFSDPLTRDFMMGRFLPAAKAVASETPQFTSRKSSVPREKPQPSKNVLAKQIPRYYDIPNTLPHNVHGELEREEEKDDSDEYDDEEDLSAKFCGLLPRFCLLNPIPGMRDHTQAISSVRSVRTRSAYAGVCGKAENKDERSNQGVQKQTTCQYGSTNKSSSNTRLSCNSIAPRKNGSPQSFIGKEKGFLGLPEDFKDLRANKLDMHEALSTKPKALLTDHNAEEVTSPVNPTIEKTLYIDSEQREECQDSNSSSSESGGRNPSVDYSVQAITPLCGADEKAVSQSRSSDACSFSSSEKSNQDASEETVNDSRKDQDVSLVVDIQQPLKPAVEEVAQKICPSLALAPFLPKSPSESWLSRTLPSMSSKNQSSKSYVGNLAYKSSPLDPKRERMLKTSNAQHMLFRAPGVLATILEN